MKWRLLNHAEPCWTRLNHTSFRSSHSMVGNSAFWHLLSLLSVPFWLQMRVYSGQREDHPYWDSASRHTSVSSPWRLQQNHSWIMMNLKLSKHLGPTLPPIPLCMCTGCALHVHCSTVQTEVNSHCKIRTAGPSTGSTEESTRKLSALFCSNIDFNRFDSNSMS